MVKALQRLTLLVAGAILSCAVTACGDAGDAPFSPNPEVCPDLDEHLAPVLALTQSEGLEHLPGVFNEDMNASDVRVLMGLAIDLASVLDSVSKHSQRRDELRGHALARMEMGLARSVHWLIKGGIQAPYDAFFDALSRGLALEECGSDVFVELTSELVAQDALLEALWELIADPEREVRQLVLALEAPRGDPRAGLRQVIASCMEAAMSSDFRIESWTALLGLVMDTSHGPGASLVTELERTFQAEAMRERLRAAVTCVAVADPALTASDLLYDLLTEVPEGSSQTEPAWDVGLLSDASIILGLRSLTEVFIADSAALLSFERLTQACLAPKRRLGVLTELGLLLSAGVLTRFSEVALSVTNTPCSG